MTRFSSEVNPVALDLYPNAPYGTVKAELQKSIDLKECDQKKPKYRFLPTVYLKECDQKTVGRKRYLGFFVVAFFEIDRLLKLCLLIISKNLDLLYFPAWHYQCRLFTTPLGTAMPFFYMETIALRENTLLLNGENL
jgi:hypothetical protein